MKFFSSVKSVLYRIESSPVVSYRSPKLNLLAKHCPQKTLSYMVNSKARHRGSQNLIWLSLDAGLPVFSSRVAIFYFFIFPFYFFHLPVSISTCKIEIEFALNQKFRFLCNGYHCLLLMKWCDVAAGFVGDCWFPV